MCNGIRECPAGEDETQLCQPQICPKHTFRCSYGKCISMKALCDNFNDCIDGSDESDLLCKAIGCSGPDCDFINCPQITSSRLNISCEFNDKKVSCENEMKPGTVAKYACKEFYQPSSVIDAFNNEAICQKDGKWSTEMLKCEPKCGYLKDPVPLIVNGWHIDIIPPWHAVMYIKQGNEWNYACGGSLITESVVLSAAHCFHETSESEVRFAIGKRHTVMSIKSDEPNAMIYDVRRIIRHPLYLDKIGNYGSDIALVELNGTVSINDDIHPVCIDWELDDITSHLKMNQFGFIVGMGITENETNSESIRMTKLPVVSHEECIKLQPKDFQKYVTFTTFCAGWGNGTAVCNGDSGGGLMFPTNDQQTWKIQGIVSLSPRRQSTFYCDPTKLTVFTKVGFYVRWIRFVLNNIAINAHNGTTQTNYEPIL